MRHTVDPIDLIRDRNPVPGAHQLPDGPESASTEALFEEIIGMDQTTTRTNRRPGRRVLLIAAAIVALSAVAAGTIALGNGMLAEPTFTGETTWDGDTWALNVGEAANDDLGTVFKVCHTFSPVEGATDGNGYGTSGCEVVSIHDEPDSVFVEIVPAIEAPDEVVVFVDMSTTPVATVSALLDDGSTVDVTPFRMPLSGKQFATIEIPDTARRVTVRAIDEAGNVIESQTLTDLTPTPPPSQ